MLSRSAARRAGRRSAISPPSPDEAPQRQLISVGAESGDYGDGCIGERRPAAFRLPRKDVREMHLDERNARPRERVPDGETRVRIRAGIHERPIGLPTQRVNGADQLALAVVLLE